MVNNIQNFVADANNIYRTKKYIVAQKIFVEDDCRGEAIVYSDDIYFIRSKRNDKLYEKYFENRTFIDGRRISTHISSKRYR